MVPNQTTTWQGYQVKGNFSLPTTIAGRRTPFAAIYGYQELLLFVSTRAVKRATFYHNATTGLPTIESVKDSFLGQLVTGYLGD